MTFSSPPSAESARLRWIDVIRALGAFLVVMAHVQYSGDSSSLARDAYYALTRAAVPLFFMASGYLLLSKMETLQDFFLKRAWKVFLPFFIWSLIYLLWQQEAFDQPFPVMVKTYLLKIVRGPRENHLWFFYELFSLYLFTPILRVYLQNADRKDPYYFIGAWLLFIPIANAFYEFTPIQVGFSYYFLGGYIGYFLFGYLMDQIQISRPVAWGVFALGFALTVAGMYINRAYELKTQYFEDYLSVNVVLMACALFAALKDLQVADSAYRYIAPLSRASFGIYLAHVIVMTEVFSAPPFSILTQIGSNVYMIPLLAILGFAFSFALTFLLQKIPVLKHIVP